MGKSASDWGCVVMISDVSPLVCCATEMTAKLNIKRHDKLRFMIRFKVTFIVSPGAVEKNRVKQHQAVLLPTVWGRISIGWSTFIIPEDYKQGHDQVINATLRLFKDCWGNKVIKFLSLELIIGTKEIASLVKNSCCSFIFNPQY
jgi:hypothetical protein